MALIDATRSAYTPRPRERRLDGGGVLRRRALGVSALHPPDRMGRSANPRGSPLGAPRTDRRLATLPGGEADQRTSSRPLAGLPRERGASGPGRRSRALGRAHHRRQAGKRRTKAMNLIAELEAEQIKALGKDIPDFAAGDTVRVGYKVTEGSRSPRAGLRGRLHRPQRRLGHRRQLHRAQDLLRRGRRARLPAALARTSIRSPWSAAARSAGPSSTTCASAAANPPASARRPTTAKRPRAEEQRP